MRERKQKLTKRELLQRRQHRIQTATILLSVLCIAGIGLMAFLNRQPAGSRYTYTTGSDIWYVDDEGIEIAAPDVEAEETAEPEPSDDAPVPTDVPVPEIVTTAEPTETPEPTAEPAIEPTSEPTAKPTEEPAPEPVPETTPVTITITATGDVTLGTYTTRYGGTSNFKKAVEKMGYEYFLENFRELFEKDDLTIVNLEGPLTSHSQKRAGRTFNFRGYPEYVNILTSASVEICNLANNHALDYQEQGFKDTYNTLTEAGIGASGYGPEYYTEVNGYTVGSLGFTEWNFAEKDILKKVKAAREKCDLLIVSMHWNEEGHGEFSKYTRRMGQALVDAGADIVIGNHPHVYGGIMKYNGKYILNSLGNFCFGGNDNPGTRVSKCMVFRQRFIMQPDGSVEDGGIDIIPAWISGHRKYNDFQPLIADPKDGKDMLADIFGTYSKSLSLEDVIWMDDSYVYQHGILENPNATAAPTPNSQLPQMDIPQDIAY